ncbi:NUDIX domain-containing protein [Alsobacter sp. SYSU M60028]|uniref:NUDIX domain-containing protein n=1 Tax=Alsobacter ponti TaxID=2962936 RepID=A0ABT1L6H7_9HYPH|nr:NUDIX domain-containing protein [Alsobacter ponti]MCP8936994.1 NUDIX domain-containing protein [Alsobacter ponti]
MPPLVHRAMQRGMHAYWRFARPMTLGVRAALIDEERGVFLIRHAYTPGWHMPGGGVEAGESALEALARECAEEGHIALDETPVLHGLFQNRHVSRRDHVAVYVVRRFRQLAERRPDREILEARFFALDALPADVTRGTQARLREILDGAAPAERW